jgi:hypothetical protein
MPLTTSPLRSKLMPLAALASLCCGPAAAAFDKVAPLPAVGPPFPAPDLKDGHRYWRRSGSPGVGCVNGWGFFLNPSSIQAM